MVIKVPKSKNGQLRRGDEVVISELPSRACPVQLLKKSHQISNFSGFQGFDF